MTFDDGASVAGSPYEVVTGEASHAREIAKLSKAIEQVPLFRELSAHDRELVAKLVQRAHADTDEVLVRKGDPGSELLIILEGEARVEANGSEVARISAGEFFGEISLLDGKPRSASVIARTPMSVLIIQKAAFDHLLGTVPGLAQRMIEVLCARLRGRGAVPFD